MPKTISGKAAQRRLWAKKAFLSAKLSPLFRSDTLELTPMAPMAPDSPSQVLLPLSKLSLIASSSGRKEETHWIHGA
jgi:hypothetical protein